MKSWLDKAGSFGSVMAAAACPVCFPKLAALGVLLGLGALGSYEGALFAATKVLVVLSLAGHLLAYRQHRSPWILSVALAGGAAFFVGLYAAASEGLVYAGFAALAGASVVDPVRRLMARKGLRSAITCPRCGFRRVETMPTDACQFFYECRGCGTLLRPKAGDCCVFCSYGSAACPPKQAERACCG